MEMNSPQDDLRGRRRLRVGPSLSLAYETPLEIVRGEMQFLIDRDGRRFLDCVNNVCHVGHCHPRVVKAGQDQMARINTNTRYLHETMVRYAERLAKLMPGELDVVYFVNSGSEANELALRLARAATGRSAVVVTEMGYHGHTSSMIEMSSYKHDGQGGKGAPPWVQVVPLPDTYRGIYRTPENTEQQAAALYAEQVKGAFGRAEAAGQPAAAYFTEPIIGCGGQVVPPEGYLAAAFQHARDAGALCIADEIQVGFGRVGTSMWAFEEQGALPDIVTLGKPIGNGHPLAAVVTTRRIADAFNNGMEFFSTFGGNPVSCAIGMAVLDAIESDGLMENARVVGERLRFGFEKLAEQHMAIGDVRGRGLYLGVEMVQDRKSREPDAALTSLIIESALCDGMLLSCDGPDHNVLKIKPPLPFSEEDADRVLAAVSSYLST